MPRNNVKYNEQRYDVNNGVTLCDNCHKDFHAMFGYGKNTKAQFETFKISRNEGKEAG